MRATCGGFVAALIIVLGAASPVVATEMSDKVKIEVSSVGLHPGLDPGLYVCAKDHLHIKGTVRNVSQVPLGRIKIAGKAFDADGKLLGTATSATKQASLAPGETAEINVEFLSVTGAQIQQVKKHELAVVDAPVTR